MSFLSLFVEGVIGVSHLHPQNIASMFIRVRDTVANDAHSISYSSCSPVYILQHNCKWVILRHRFRYYVNLHKVVMYVTLKGLFLNEQKE